MAKKKGKKREDSGPSVNMSAALYAYQIAVMEKDLLAYTNEWKALDAKIQTLTSENEKLKSEQKNYIRNLLLDSRRLGDELLHTRSLATRNLEEVDTRKKERKNKLEVENGEYQRKNDRLTTELRSVRDKLNKWAYYRDIGRHEDGRKVKNLENQVRDLDNTFKEMRDYIACSLEKSRSDMAKSVGEARDKQKEWAAEEAALNLDSGLKQEICDNQWLLDELKIHQREYEAMEAAVEVVEGENLDLVANILDQKLGDLHHQHLEYLTNFGLRDKGVLAQDFKNLSYVKQPLPQSTPTVSPLHPASPSPPPSPRFPSLHPERHFAASPEGRSEAGANLWGTKNGATSAKGPRFCRSDLNSADSGVVVREEVEPSHGLDANEASQGGDLENRHSLRSLTSSMLQAKPIAPLSVLRSKVARGFFAAEDSVCDFADDDAESTASEEEDDFFHPDSPFSTFHCVPGAFLHLGSLQLKLLSVCGTKMTLHCPPKTKMGAAQIRASAPEKEKDDFLSDRPLLRRESQVKWPISPQNLLNILTTKESGLQKAAPQRSARIAVMKSSSSLRKDLPDLSGRQSIKMS